MDEFRAVLKARELVGKVNPATAPASVKAYADHVGAVIRYENDMEAGESGCTMERNGRHYIHVNAADSSERQRFTICHEIAHIVLKLPSEHDHAAWSYARRSPNEIICDVFASELLLPVRLFKPLADRAEIGFAAINDLAARFEASTLATGSRFAAVTKPPCAFVFSEQGKVRYASRSAVLREAYGWVPPRMDLPANTLSARLRAGNAYGGTAEVEADIWFENWRRGGVLLEEARHFSKWDQTSTLLWFEDEELPPMRRDDRDPRADDNDEQGLEDLDGTLPWPGKKRRR